MTVNGNTTADSLHTYAWDAEGRSVTIDTVGLTYDALGRMVEQQSGSSYTEILYGPTGKLALMNGQTVTKAFIPLPAGAKAVYTSGPTLSYFRHPDWLGSSRFASTVNRTMYYSGAYAPFGEAYSEAGTADRSFTGQNQDTVSGTTAGLYDFLFREYVQYGRWASPDPAGMAAVELSNPQSWNRYAYAYGNPLSHVDPLGLETCTVNGDTVSCTMDNPPGDDPDDSDVGGFFFGVNSSNRMLYWDPIYGQQIHPEREPVVSQNPPETTAKSILCSALPSGSITSIGGSIGGVGGQTGSLSAVVNYNTGEVSLFASGGLQAGWNGGASASISSGYIWNMSSNTDFSGPFQNVSASSSEGPGGSVSWASNGVKVAAVSLSATLVPTPTGGYSYTCATQPLATRSIGSSSRLSDVLLYGARQLLCKD